MPTRCLSRPAVRSQRLSLPTTRSSCRCSSPSLLGTSSSDPSCRAARRCHSCGSHPTSMERMPTSGDGRLRMPSCQVRAVPLNPARRARQRQGARQRSLWMHA
eukprot:1435544-Prymnesium_polylepis.1